MKFLVRSARASYVINVSVYVSSENRGSCSKLGLFHESMESLADSRQRAVTSILYEGS